MTKATLIATLMFLVLSGCKHGATEDGGVLETAANPAVTCPEGPKDYAEISRREGTLSLSGSAKVSAGLREFAIDLYNLEGAGDSAPSTSVIESVLDPDISAYCAENPGRYFLRYIKATGGELARKETAGENDASAAPRPSGNPPRVWAPGNQRIPLPEGWMLTVPEGSEGAPMMEYCRCDGESTSRIGMDRLLGLDEQSFALGSAEDGSSDENLPEHIEELFIADPPDGPATECPDQARQVAKDGRQYCQYEVTAKVASYIAPFDNSVGNRQNPGQCHFDYAADRCGMGDWEPDASTTWPTLRRELFANHYNEKFRENSGYAGGSWGYALFCVPSVLGVGSETERPRGYQDVKTRFFCPLVEGGPNLPLDVAGHTPSWDFDKPEKTGHELLRIYGTHNETGDITTVSGQKSKRIHVGWWGQPNNKPNYYAKKASLTDHGSSTSGNGRISIPFSRNNTGRGNGNIWADFYMDVTCRDGQLRRGHAASLSGSNFPTQWAHAKIESVGGRKKTYVVTMRHRQGKFCELFKTEVNPGNTYPQTHVVGDSPFLVLDDHLTRPGGRD